MDFIHRNCVVHGDLKMSNIMIDSPMRIRVIDFGYSSCLADPNDLVTCYSGTPVYLAPEVIRQSPYDGRPDKASRPMCGRSGFCFTKC